MSRSHLVTAPLLLASALGISRAAFAQQVPPTDLVGDWLGTLRAGVELRLVFHVRREADGTLSATIDSPDQGATGLPISEVIVDGRSVRLASARVGGAFEGTMSDDGDALEGTWSQGGARLPLRLARATEDDLAPRRRPQEPEDPLPYRAEDVRIPTAVDSVELAGTLTIPEGDGPFPAAVLVSGSGPQNRDEELLGHKPFLVIADHLTRAGIAVLRYDDRGVGASTGSFATATSVQFTDDAIAAVEFARARAEIRDDAVGIIGHSEGGLVGPAAAARSEDVAFVVMLAGPGITGAEIILAQGELIARASGTPETIVELNRRTQLRLFEAVRSEPDPIAAAPVLREILEDARDEMPESLRETQTDQAIRVNVGQVNSPWMRHFLDYDPRPPLEQVRVPVLALNGEKDLQVPWEANLREIEAALERGGNPDATVRMLPGLNHLFQHAETGSPAEYARIEETFAPQALELVASWIGERFARPIS